jgi:AraC-like DNA-binding protein
MDRIRITHSLPTRFEELGISLADVLRQAGLPQALFEQERIVVTTAQWFALLKALGTINDDPSLGLRLGSDVVIEQFNPLSLAAISARSFHEALTKMARYKRLFCSEEMSVIDQDGTWIIEAIWVAAREPAPPLLIDSMFASFIELGRRGTGRELYPERITLRREPQHRAMYEAHFHCPVEFGADHNRMVYSHQALLQPFRTYNPDLLALLEPQLETELHDSAARQTFAEQVKALLRSRLPGKQPTMQDVADELHISARTLQRRLAEDGVGFQQLLEAVRREMAQQYLTVSSLDLNEIAYLLGYEEASSFHRAFHHWEGTSPGQWRAAQRVVVA